MNTKLIVAASALMLALSATPALGYTGSRDVVLPGGWNDAFTGGFSLALCERVSDDATLSGVSPIYCERSGFGAFFSDIGCSADFYPTANPALFFGNSVPDNNNGCLDDLDGSPNADRDGDGGSPECWVLTPTVACPSPVTDDCFDTLAPVAEVDFNTDCDVKDDFAMGNVTVSQSQQEAGNEASWLVGNDRDDDGSVTSTDTDGSSDGTQEGSTSAADCDQNNDGIDDPALAGCFDDEFIFGTDDVTVGFKTPDFCFTRDRDHAGGDWDDVVVFFSANLPPTTIGSDTPFVGTAKVDLKDNSSNTACTRSGHGDNVASLGGTPFASVDAGSPLELVVIAAVNGVSIVVDGTDLDCGIDTDGGVPSTPPGDLPLVSISGVGSEPFGTSVTCQTNGATCDSFAVVVVSTGASSASTGCGGSPATASVPASGVLPVWFDANTGGTSNWTCSLNPGTAVVSVAVCVLATLP